MGRETQAAVKRLVSLLSNKWEQEYEEIYAYVRARLSLSMERSFLHLLRG